MSVNLTIEMKTSSSDCVIQADPHQMSQVVRNLVSNALKFTNKPGEVKIVVDVVPGSMYECTSKSSDINDNHKKRYFVRKSSKVTPTEANYSEAVTTDFIRLSVTDYGAGISEENQAKLFKGIIQFNPGKLQAGKGTGLGLYISKGIVDMHRGHLIVNSAGEDQGATFTLLLPVESTAASAYGDGHSPRMAGSQSTQDMESMKMTSSSTICLSKLKNGTSVDHFAPNELYRFSSMDGQEEVSSDDLLNGDGTKPVLFRRFSGTSFTLKFVCGFNYSFNFSAHLWNHHVYSILLYR